MGKLDATLAILNGVVGDHLVRSGNALATEMSWALHDRALVRRAGALASAYPKPTAKLVVLVHGLMTTERVWRFRDGDDYGSRLAAELGYTPLYLRYNSGRPIPDSGGDLADMLEALLHEYPIAIDEIVLLGYSMGGLVVRSACHAGSMREQRWLAKVKRAIYVGTPHRGAPLERAGRTVAKILQAIDDPYTNLIADLANVRSAGLKDLGDAHLRHEDRERAAISSLRDPRHPVPLLDSIQHYLIAGSLSKLPLMAALFGDALVPLSSATDGACASLESLALPPEHVRLLLGLGHVDLAHHPDVCAVVREFCRDT
jgi:pimeloyl-ACP methyl ester carboxylesterase